MKDLQDVYVFLILFWVLVFALLGHFLIKSFFKTVLLLMLYSVCFWISIMIVDRRLYLGVWLIGIYSVILSLVFLKYYRERSKQNGQLKVISGAFHPNNHPGTIDDKLLRFLSDEKKMDQIHVRIQEFLSEKKAFLQQRYSLSQLALDIDIPRHHLSTFINHYYEINFNDLINKYRVSYSKEMIINGEWKQKKLSAIAEESGFNNRNTFTTAFKKVTGQNPSVFLRRTKGDQEHDHLSLRLAGRA
jgi:AraC-like DNA-binding protein